MLTSRHRRLASLGRQPRLILSAAVAVLTVPVVADVVGSGRRRLFSYFAADAFYYLEVARNWALDGRVSFDGDNPTNGFHPLWQIALTGIYRVSSAVGLGQTEILYVDLLACLVLTALAVVLLGRSINRATGRLPPWFAAIPVGAYAVLLAPAWVRYGGLDHARSNFFEGRFPLYGTLWSYVNGMESALALFLFAVFVAVVVRGPITRPGSPVVLGLALGGVTLARLDLVFLPLSFVGFLLVLGATGSRPGLRRTAIKTSVVFAAVIAVYVLWNHAYAGTYLPVSGSTKTTFPNASLGNARDFWSFFEGNGTFALERLFRHAPIIIPSVIAVSYLVGSGFRRAVWAEADLSLPHERYRLVLTATACSVLLLSAYDWLFVPLFDQGNWYWPVSTMFVSLVALEWLDSVSAKRESMPIAPIVLASITLGFAFFAIFHHRPDYHRRYADFYFEVAPDVRRFYGAQPPKLLAADDGIDAFALGFPSLSGTGLSLDREAASRAERDELLHLATERGFTRISSVVYLPSAGLDRDTSSDELRERVRQLLLLRHEDLSAFDFRIEYISTRLASSRCGDTATVPDCRPYVIIRVVHKR
jgi:hypothetical protein